MVDKNLRLIPGCSYPIGANFSNLPMPEDSPFRASWWYRTQFRLPASYRGRNVWLNFDGINFRANIWLNGQQIATSAQIAGTFCIHELNIKNAARAGELNTLAVEVYPPQPDDLAWTWVDWNPMPPDKNMGIFRDVFLTSSGPVTLRYPQVVTSFDLPSLRTAHLTVNAEAHNATDIEVAGTVSARLAGLRLSQKVTLGPQETKSVSFTPADFPQLNISQPRLWWPLHMGHQNLYGLVAEFETGGEVSDRQDTRFGIREITSELDSQNHRLFKVNGRNVLIRGGGWSSDIFLRSLPERLKSEFEYVKDMNLNTIRLEGQLQPDSFFDLADQYGILIMAGWCCCSHWEHWQHRSDYQEGPTWDKEDYEIAAKCQTDLIWHLYDYYLMPGGGYFGTKKACEPVHVQYSYKDKSVIAVNTTYRPLRDLKLTAQVYDINLAAKFSRVLKLDLPADSNSRAFVIPQIQDLSTTYFLRLLLEDSNGQLVSSNFYWLSTKDDVLDWQKSTWYYNLQILTQI